MMLGLAVIALVALARANTVLGADAQCWWFVLFSTTRAATMGSILAATDGTCWMRSPKARP
ncbi:MAG: hypothetical protein VXY70_05980, partial [Actinomycetota bacterium]|nr:hypothetical protein [Actinomycetota bacterium]